MTQIMRYAREKKRVAVMPSAFAAGIATFCVNCEICGFTPSSVPRSDAHTAGADGGETRTLLQQIAQARDADGLATGEWLGVVHADRPAPEGGLIAQPVDERR
jgi:hypothetical protein